MKPNKYGRRWTQLSLLYPVIGTHSTDPLHFLVHFLSLLLFLRIFFLSLPYSQLHYPLSSVFCTDSHHIWILSEVGCHQLPTLHFHPLSRCSILGRSILISASFICVSFHLLHPRILPILHFSSWWWREDANWEDGGYDGDFSVEDDDDQERDEDEEMVEEEEMEEKEEVEEEEVEKEEEEEEG